MSAGRPVGPTLGIDFGTSNCAVALLDQQGNLHHIALDGTRATMPTALYFSSHDGHVSFGTAALYDYLNDLRDGVGAGRLMRAIKSLLGSTLIDEKTVVNGQSVSYFDLVVLFFRELKCRAEAQLGYRLHAAMLGRPVHFVDDNPVRDRLAQTTLKRAAHAAGFEHVGFELEPIAAAFDFERRIQSRTQVLVADIGGGTSDFTMVQLRPDRPSAGERHGDILATSGIHLGGTDFDRLLSLGCVMPHLGYGQRTPAGRELPNRVFYELATWHLVHHASSRNSLAQARDLWRDYIDLDQHRRLIQVLTQRLGHQLLAEVESAKIACSEHAISQPINLGALSSSDQFSVVTAQLSPTRLKNLLQTQLLAITNCALQCVRDAGMTQPEVLYLTGGSSALTALTDEFRAAFPEATVVHGDRFGGVASGLALAGQQLRDMDTA